MTHKKLIVMDYGGHARSVADVAFSSGYDDFVFFDKNAKPGERFLNYPVIPSMEGFFELGCDAISAAGDNLRRAKQCQMILEAGLNLVNVISPHASIGLGASIGMGCFVGHHAHIGPMASIEDGVIVNTGAIVEHESSVGAYAHVSVNSSIAGRSSLGKYSLLGIGASVIDGISVTDYVSIGAGAVVHRSILESGIYVGIPAKRIKSLVEKRQSD